MIIPKLAFILQIAFSTVLVDSSKSTANQPRNLEPDSDEFEKTSGWMIFIFVIISVAFVLVLGVSVRRVTNFYKSNLTSKTASSHKSTDNDIWGLESGLNSR